MTTTNSGRTRKILTVLTYYRPHTSGLTIYAERLARGLVARGHRVTVLTSRFDPASPIETTELGVRVVRAPVLLRISKGVIMPTFGLLATRLVREHDVISSSLGYYPFRRTFRYSRQARTVDRTQTHYLLLAHQ